MDVSPRQAVWRWIVVLAIAAILIGGFAWKAVDRLLCEKAFEDQYPWRRVPPDLCR